SSNLIPLKPFAPGSGQANFYWLYLRRPANPFDPNSPKVVVDSVRLPYFDAGYTGAAGNPDDTVTPNGPSQAVYSVQRLQPYRGGHAVPFNFAASGTTTSTTGPAPKPMNYLGYSEQPAPPPNVGKDGQYVQTGGKFYYGTFGTKGGKPLASTQQIIHTLG